MPDASNLLIRRTERPVYTVSLHANRGLRRVHGGVAVLFRPEFMDNLMDNDHPQRIRSLACDRPGELVRRLRRRRRRFPRQVKRVVRSLSSCPHECLARAVDRPSPMTHPSDISVRAGLLGLLHASACRGTSVLRRVRTRSASETLPSHGSSMHRGFRFPLPRRRQCQIVSMLKRTMSARSSAGEGGSARFHSSCNPAK
jgi:hypothetical protein